MRYKYIPNGVFADAGTRGGSQVKHLFDWGATFKVNDGKLTRLWLDVWLGTVHLKI